MTDITRTSNFSRSRVPERPRFLSEADCHDIAQRLARYAKGGGETAVHLVSRWTGNVRWARNRIMMTGETRDNRVAIKRFVHGAESYNGVVINEVSDAALVAAARRAERLVQKDAEHEDADVGIRPGSPFRFQSEPATVIPNLFSEATYQLDAEHRAEAAQQSMLSVTKAGMLSAGYIEVSATSFAYITSWGYSRYYQYTWAHYSTTVRDPKGTGSGWAGVDWPDWSKIDSAAFSAVALEKGLASRNPVAIEPGRYTTILEPQAVCDFVDAWGFKGEWRNSNEDGARAPFHKTGGNGTLGFARFGERVIDERLTIGADPMDPDLGFSPYKMDQRAWYDEEVFHPVTWIERGVLKNLPYDRSYAISKLGQDPGLPASGALRMSVNGQTTSIDDMIASTIRGVLVTRFDQVLCLNDFALLYRGYTRDGLWLIEHGKISRPVKNMVFTESILFALNNVEQVGVPQRTFHPVTGWRMVWINNPEPVIVPALKIKDFSFTALSDAV